MPTLPLRLPDGSLVVPPRYAATVAAACETALQLDPNARNGPVISARLRAVINVIAESGNAATNPGTIPEDSNPKLGSAEAARVLGVKPRRVRQLGEQIGGRQLSNGRWEFDAAKVYAEATRRKAA
ncbi:hypothetical protein [Streptomyces sp. NPDC005303]|uniref:hypothetical protein n=1 Tax=Streptomyces sp. NPDC005303 TaxID=3155713 RepID=UPI0033B31CDA